MTPSGWERKDGLRLLERALYATQNGVMITDATEPDDPIVWVNAAFEKITGYAAEEVIGRNPRFLQAGDSNQPALDDLRASRESNDDDVEWKGVLRNYTKDGTLFHNELVAAAVRDDEGRATHHIGFVTDVTKREEAEERLRFQAELLDAVGQAVVAVDLSGRITHWNRAAERLYGWPSGEAVGRPAHEVMVSEEQMERAGEVWGELMAGRSWSGEFVVRRRDGTAFPAAVIDTPVFDERGNPAGIIGVSEDITERKEAEEERLRVSREYEEMVRVLPNVVFRWRMAEDGAMRLTYSEGALAEEFGVDTARAAGRALGELFPPEFLSTVVPAFERAFAGETVEFPSRIGERSFTNVAMPFRAASGARGRSREVGRAPADEIVGYVVEVTERVRAEEALKESEERFGYMVRNSSDIITLVGADGTILYLSPALERVLGYGPEERAGGSILDLLHPDDVEKTRRLFAEGLKRPGVSLKIEVRQRHKDGSWRDMEVTGTNLLADPSAGAVVLNSRDVTERKRAEAALRESERRFRQLFENSADALLVVHPETREVVDCNREACRSLGYPREELLGLRLEDFASEVLTEEEKRRRGPDTPWRRALAGEPGTIIGFHENVHRRKDGTVFPVEVGVGSIDYAGRRMILASCRDATKRKRAEEALRESEERFRAVVEQTGDGIYLLDVDTRRIVEANAAFARLLGHAPEELPGMAALDFVTQSPKELEDNIRRTLEEGRRFVGERRYRRKDGSPVDVEVSVSVISYGGHEVICAAVRDVTERKRFEEALRESEERFRALVQNASDIVTVLDADGTVRYQSLAVERVMGYRPEELVGENVFGYVHPDDLERTLDAFAESLRSPEAPVRAEFRFRHKDGSWRHLETIGSNLLSDPAVGGVVINSRDVTARKEAEGALRKSNELLRAVMEGTTDAVFVKDLDGRYLTINRAGAEAFGKTVEEVIGRTDAELFSAEDGREVVEADREIAASGEVRTIEDTKTTEDGVTRTYLVTKGPYRDAAGDVVGVFGVSRDITERKRVEDALREAEEGHRRRARELSLLHEVRSAVARELGLGPVFRAVVEAVAESYGYVQVSAYLLEGTPEDGVLVLQHQVGYETVIERIPTTEGVTGRAVRTGRPVLVEDVREDPAFLGAIEGITSEVCAPLFDEGQVVGFLNVESTGGRTLGEDDLRLTESVAEHVGVAIGKAALHERIKESEERFRALVQNATDVIAVLDADGKTLYLSPSLEGVQGRRPGHRIGRSAFEDVHPDDLGEAKAVFAGLLAEPGSSARLRFRLRHADGSWRHLEAVAKNLLSDPAVGGVVVNARDVTERREFEERLEHRALHDALTGLPNRVLFADRLEHALARNERRGGKVAVLFLDLDNFKYVNDSLGHEMGDGLLVAVAERLRAALRPSDTAARLGGDEFAVLLEGVGGDGREAERVAGRIVEGLREPFALGGGQEVFVTPSIGIAAGGGPGGDAPEDLLRRADLAMYEAKRGGKARYAVFDPETERRSVRRLRLENGLRRAIERDELVVRYQPVVRLSSGRIAGFEALVRWEHPERGLVMPEEFVALAEETGLIVPIGQKVLGEACRQAKGWRVRHPGFDDPPPVVGVNLSPRQLSHPGLVGDVKAALDEAGLEPGRLTLEITEGALVEDAERSAATLRGLEDLGVRFALDDFGTGYSSLSYLRRLPVGMLKIDRSFVQRLGQDREDEVLLGGVVGIAHGLGLLVCAEGVETAEQLARARTLGCDLAQGNLLSGPLTGEEAAAFLSGDPKGNGSN